MKTRIIFLLLLLVCVSRRFGQSDTEKTYSEYLNCNLNYFWDNDFENPLFKGLKAITLGEYEKAEKILLKIIPQVSDSLEMSIYTDLAYINYTQKKWAKGNEYVQLSDADFDANANPFIFFPEYPKESVTIKQDSVVVDLIDGFYIQGRINNSDIKENIIVDTGWSPSAISLSLANKYNLKMDSTKYQANLTMNIPSVVYSAYIEKLKIGNLEFHNIPVNVIGDELFNQLKLNAQMVFGLTEMMMFDAVKFDYPKKEFVMIKQTHKKDIPSNYAILDFHAITNYKIQEESISGLIDTGSPFSYLFLSEKWKPEKFTPTKSVEKSWGDYKYTVKYYEFAISFSNCFDGEFELQILPQRTPPHRFKKESLLGKDIWSKKSLVLDFNNRRIYCEEP